MNRHFSCAAVALALAAPAAAEPIREATVRTHPSQGEVVAVEAASASLLRYKGGFFVSLDTHGLTPGHVHTLWLVVINDPAACYDEAAVEAAQKASPEDCNSRDVLLRTAEVESDVGYAGGLIVGPDGTARYAFHQREGALDGAWFGTGLDRADKAEVHLVVNDHGPLLAGREREMLTSYRDGCKDESIPGPMPPSARTDGEAGPNVCRLVQTAVFKRPGKSS